MNSVVRSAAFAAAKAQGAPQGASEPRFNPLLAPAPATVPDPLSALYVWMTDVYNLVNPLMHNDNAVCIMSIIKEIAECEIDGYAAMIAKGKELYPEFEEFMRALIRDCTVLTGKSLQSAANEVFGDLIHKTAVQSPKPKPLPAINPLLARPVQTPQQRALL